MPASPQVDAVSASAGAPTPPRNRGASRLAAYIALTKPRIIELLLVTTVPVMFAAAGGLAPLWTVVATVIGGTLAAGGANAFNCVLDADIDAHMGRTAHRPIVTGEISARAGTVFGGALSMASIVFLWATTNSLSALLAASAIAAYVVGYTIILKRRTSQNIVWGGVAGCFPVLIGWAAVTGKVPLAAWVLFLLVFVWTPAHYWPLSLKYRDDYIKARVPMLGAVAPERVVIRSVLAYTVATTVVAVAYGLVGDGAGWAYWLISSMAGAWFIAEAFALMVLARGARVSVGSTLEDGEVSLRGLVAARAMRVFHVSISYLALVFLAVGIDPFVR